MNVVLVGYMGSGKTSVGMALAEKLSLKFIDTDVEIERQERISISQIFKTKGENYFRDLETNFLWDNKFEDTVIAVGGGLPCFHNNMKKLNQIGKTVYLFADAELLVNRLINHSEKESRPLISEISVEEMMLNTTDRLKKREPYYELSQLQVNASFSVENIVNEISFCLKKTSIERGFRL